MSNEKFEKDLSGEKKDNQNSFGKYILFASAILSISIIVASIIITKSFSLLTENIYYIFLVFAVGGYVVYQRYNK